MSSIDEKFKKVIAEQASPEEVKEDAATGDTAIKKEGTTSIVADDFTLSTAADIVADPSAPDAFVQGIYEGKEWCLVDGAIKEAQLEAVKQSLDNAPSTQELAERKIAAFNSLLRSL